MIYKAIQGLPQAYARIKGSKEYPDIRGNVYLYEVYNGTVLLGELMESRRNWRRNTEDFLDFIFMKEMHVQEMQKIHLQIQKDTIIQKKKNIPDMQEICRRY